MATTHTTTYEVITGDAATIKSTLESYEQTKHSHTLKVLGFAVDGSGYHVLVKYQA
jgi:hypothetical protein